jgi:hypothetical protein
MSSNFWLESDDEWDDDIYSSESGSEQGEVKPTSRFADIDMDDEEEDSKRVTRSAHEKSWDELNKSIKVIKNKMFINDWNTVSSGTPQPYNGPLLVYRTQAPTRFGRFWTPTCPNQHLYLNHSIDHGPNFGILGVDGPVEAAGGLKKAQSFYSADSYGKWVETGTVPTLSGLACISGVLKLAYSQLSDLVYCNFRQNGRL